MLRVLVLVTSIASATVVSADTYCRDMASLEQAKMICETKRVKACCYRGDK